MRRCPCSKAPSAFRQTSIGYPAQAPPSLLQPTMPWLQVTKRLRLLRRYVVKWGRSRKDPLRDWFDSRPEFYSGEIELRLPCHFDRLPQPGIERKLLSELQHLPANPSQRLRIRTLRQRLADPLADGAHLRLLHAAGSQRRRADADARGLERRIRVIWNRVLVHCDARIAESGLGFAAEHALGEDVHQHQVRIRATGNNAEALRLHRFCQHACVSDDLRRI